MSEVIDLKESRFLMAVKRGFRNWESRFKERFGPDTRISHISVATLSYLAQGKDKGTFHIYDLIMNIRGLGSGFEFHELSPKKKMAVIDHYLFLLDQIRFECMKRLGWIESYSGEEFTLVELIADFENLAPGLQAQTPLLSRNHPGYDDFTAMTPFDKEGFIRKLIPSLLEEIRVYSTTL